MLFPRNVMFIKMLSQVEVSHDVGQLPPQLCLLQAFLVTAFALQSF